MRPEIAQRSTMTSRRKALAAAAAAILLPAVARAGDNRKARWTYPIEEFDACVAMIAAGEIDPAHKRLTELRPTIVYLASLDPRE